MIRKVVVIFVILFLALQFIRPDRNSGTMSGPHDITHYVDVPDTVKNILIRSCYDCHSNHTIYPWYANVNPVGLWLKNHIDEGKRAINFSDLSGMNKKKLNHRMKDIAEQVDAKEMPLSSYTLIHRNAILDSGQTQLLKNWTVKARKEIDYKP
jgi:hypothetical protein